MVLRYESFISEVSFYAVSIIPPDDCTRHGIVMCMPGIRRGNVLKRQAVHRFDGVSGLNGDVVVAFGLERQSAIARPRPLPAEPPIAVPKAPPS
jgi:hypothetical protein